MTFAKQIIEWQIKFGRHNLPWQANRDPYRILLSEIMLQQTQVATVIPFFNKFIKSFPSIESLAQASEDSVMSHWAGLGYYRRARNLHSLAKIIISTHSGTLPHDAKSLAMLPGIGRSTAAAIACFAFQGYEPILDGNVKRIFSRAFMIEGPINQRSTEKSLWQLAENLMPQPPLSASIYAQGLMDLGSKICIREKPNCQACPVQTSCQAFLTNSQQLFPQRTIKKTLPLRDATVLIFHNDRQVLLEKRPSSGIWGGLWSLPEIPSSFSAQMQKALKSSYEKKSTQLTDVLHTFTHFRLKIKTIISFYESNFPITKPFKLVEFQEIEKYGLPTPIKRILVTFLKAQRLNSNS